MFSRNNETTEQQHNQKTKQLKNRRIVVWLISCLVNKFSGQRGLSIIEVILAMAIFVIITSTSVAVVIHSFSTNRLGEEETKAALLASEGLEAVRSIKKQDFSNLVAGTYDVASIGGFWQLGPTPTPGGKFGRKITIADAYRDEQGEIVESGGTLDEETKKVTSSVSWKFSPVRLNTVELKTYLTNWISKICFWLDGEVVGSGDTVVDGKHINAEARDVIVMDEYAYLVTDYALADGPEFFIFDITTPSGELELTGSLNLDVNIRAVYVYEGFAYLATSSDNQELMVINVSDPYHPQVVGSYNADSDGTADGRDVWVEGSTVYFSTEANLSAPADPELYLLQVNTSDPYNVTFSPLGSLDIDQSINGLFVVGNYAYLATSEGSREFQIIDISNPMNPQRVCWYDFDSGSGNAVSVEENRAYLATEKDGNKHEYFVLSLNPPYDGCSGNPESFISQVASAKIDADTNGVFVYSGYVFLANEKGDKELRVASLEDPTNFILEFNLYGKAYGVYVYGCLAYVATGNNDAELQIIQPR